VTRLGRVTQVQIRRQGTPGIELSDWTRVTLCYPEKVGKPLAIGADWTLVTLCPGGDRWARGSQDDAAFG
jgi:hypothetical protein